MNCREFEDLWDDLLDARGEAPAHLERALESHASGCAPCQATSRRYQVLRQAIGGFRPPTASAESMERLYALTVPSGRPTIPIDARRGRHRLAKVLAVAASFALAWFGVSWRPAPEPAERPASPLAPAITPRRSLGLALADATEATLDLAREASAPASRIGREAIDLGKSSTSGLDAPTAPGEESAPTVDADADPAPSGLLKSVGERVRPISGSARHAFSFLLGPPDEAGPAAGKQDSL